MNIVDVILARPKSLTMREKVLQFIRERKGPVRYGEVERITGGRTNMSGLLDSLLKEGKIIRLKRGYYIYAL